MKKSHITRRAASLLLALALCLGLVPSAFAAQPTEYRDPAEHWLQGGSRTNELDANAVLTHETFYCPVCGMTTSFSVWRTPEYARDGQTALTRNVLYSDGTMTDGESKGRVLDGIPGVDAYYTGYHWTKSMCDNCGTLNSNGGTDGYGFDRNVYNLYDCAAEFMQNLSESVSVEYVDGTYHKVTTTGGEYCVFCFGTRHTENTVLERHDLHTDITAQPANQRFAVTTHCHDCEYSKTSYVAAKAVVADYYGVVDGQPHTLTVSDLSESGVSTAIRYGYSANSCTLTSAPNYTEEGQYAVYYQIAYTYGGESMTENGVAYVWLRDESECGCGCGEKDCDCGGASGCGGTSCCSNVCGDNHNFTLVESVSATCAQLGYDRYVCVNCGKVEKRNYTAAIGHAYQSVLIREADCETEGKVMEICRNCGDVKVTYTAKGEHEYATYTVAATCTAPGYTVKECAVCGDRHVTDVTAANGHSYVSRVTPPTCTTGGHTLHFCTVCGDSYIDNYTEATGHSWGEGTVIKDATCLENGVIEYQCSACGLTRLEDYAESDVHSSAHARAVTLPTLSNVGTPISTISVAAPATATVTAAASTGSGHTYIGTVTAPTCAERGFTTYTCIICGDSYVSDFTAALGHSYTATVTAPTCTTLGYTTYTCSRCGDSYRSDYVGTLAHDYRAAVTAPTCTEGGYTTYTCSLCGGSFVTDYTAALGHDWQAPVILASSTCNGAGVLEYDCSRCEAHYHEAISATGHNPGPAADCINPQTCLDCGAVLAPATGHNYRAAVTPATCGKMGYTTYTCANCGDSYRSDYTEALGHAYTAAVTPATCTERGYTTHTCARCGDSYVDDYTEATGHRLDEGKILSTAVCEHEGVIQYFCRDCDYTELETIPATGHAPGAAATCTEAQVCDLCGKELAPATGHKPGDWIVDKQPTTAAEGSRYKECEVCHVKLETETLAKLYMTATTDTHGEAVVGGYFVTVTDTASVGPVANATITLNKDGAISVCLPDGRLLDYAAQTTVTVQQNADGKAAVPGLALTITDGNGSAATDTTNGKGQFTAPAASGSTNADGRAVIGYTNDDGKRMTLALLIVDADTGRPIKGASLSVARSGKLFVTLPAGVDLDDNNRIAFLIVDSAKKPVIGLTVSVSNDLSRSASGETGADGRLTVPEIVVTVTERHSAFINGYPDGTFGPSRSMTRSEAAAIFARLLADKKGDTIRNNVTTRFEDVAPGAWYAGYVQYLYGYRVAYGVSETEFAPDREITRAEFTAMAVRFYREYFGAAATGLKADAFDDVARDSWAYDAIEAAAAYGWVVGYGDGTFKPSQQIARAEAVAIVNRLLGRVADRDYITDNRRTINSFSDMTPAHWAYWDVMEAANPHTAEILNSAESWKTK